MRLDRLQKLCKVLAAATLLAVPALTPAADEAELWEALRAGDHVALMRHALAPGTGDPVNFALGDCSTQRNLSESGRAQAMAIGQQFRANGMDSARVFSSQWCRSLDTAELLGLGPVEELPVLNSFFQRRERGEQQTLGLKAWLDAHAGHAGDRPAVMVTHMVNITALSRAYPASGEIVIVRLDDNAEVIVAGTIKP